MDEENGAEAAREAKRTGSRSRCAAEKSSVPEFDFEYGEDFARHIEEFEPDFVKILARYNPEGDRELNRRQAERLARLSDYLAPRETKYLFELIVPAGARTSSPRSSPTPSATRSSCARSLVATAIAELQAAGVEPDIWKVEGLETAEDCKLVADAARAGGRDDVACVVLGAGADEATVAHWLREAATRRRVHRLRDRPHDLLGRRSRSGSPATATARPAAREIADNYRSTIDVYTGAAHAV